MNRRMCSMMILTRDTGQRLRQAQLDTRLSVARLPQDQYPTSPRALVTLEAPIEDDHNSLALVSASNSLLPSPGYSNKSRISKLNQESEILVSNPNYTPYSEPYATLSPFIQISSPLTVFSALYMNGDIQGITCAISYSSRTPMPKPHIPLPLHPTELQQMIVHPRWIDRLPFPRMRDSLIRLRGVVDEEELCKDLFTMPSFTIDIGCACWDPSGWRMEEEWKKKWGWLMI